MLQVVSVPVHGTTPLSHSHPAWPLQPVSVVWLLHDVRTPLQFVEDQLQSVSASQLVEVVFAPQGVTVPVHVPAEPDQLQYSLELHVPSLVNDVHGVAVPEQIVPAYVQPAARQ
jgi:hypothetical protein